MATAQNGWPVVPDTDAGRRKLTDLVLPGTMTHAVRVLAGDVATIARWHVAEYHRRVEPIKPAGCWGWNVRKIGNGPDWSNHSAACAWDLNAPDNPDGVPTSKVMTSAQIHECHKLERESDNVLRWGGDYKSDPDAMHWEVVGTPAQAAALAKKIRNEEDDMALSDADWVRLTKLVEESRPAPADFWNGVSYGRGETRRTVGQILVDARAAALAAGGKADALDIQMDEYASADAARDAALPLQVRDALAAGQPPEQVAAALRQVAGVDWVAVGRILAPQG